MSDAALVFVVLFAGIACGVPIWIAVALSTVVGCVLIDLPLVSLAQSSFDAFGSIPLMAVPLFVFAGALMERGGMASRIVAVARAMVGRYAGSLALVSVLGCMFFAALSGSGPATTAAVGAVTVPAMKRDRYDSGFCAAVIASGGALGVLIPPSNLMVIYGIVAEVSIPRLFLAGIIPGILVGFGLMAVAWAIARRKGYVSTAEAFSWAAVRRAGWEGKWALGAPLVILGGIYVGVFTPTEAAAVAVAYALAVGAGVYRELTWQGFAQSLRTTALICGSAVIILGPAKAFGQLMALLDVSSQITAFLSGFTSSGFVILMLMTLVLTVTGMFMESIAQIILLTPLMLPIATSLGVDPVVFGVIMVIACEVGFLTPPVGANLFIAMQVADVSLARVSAAVLPFLLPYYLSIVAIAALPALTIALPEWIYGKAM